MKKILTSAVALSLTAGIFGSYVHSLDVSDADLPHVFTVMDIQGSATWGLDVIDGSSDGKYSYESSGAGVDIYVVDTGVDATHPDLLNVVHGFDVFNEGKDRQDCHGHGTHVAGVISGSKYGVAKQSRVIPVRVLNCAGQGSTATLTSGIDWILSNYNPNRVSVVNLSLGGPKDNAVNAATERLVAGGLVVVAAAGNSNVDACSFSPASATGVIAVGSIDQGLTKSSFSNWGPCVDIFAPGSKILSDSPFNRQTAVYKSGTSQAAPFVTGALATYISAGKLSLGVSALKVLTDYSYKNVVLASNSGSNNLVSTYRSNSQTVGAPSPITAPPVPVSAVSQDVFISNITPTKVTISWSPVDGASLYSVQLGRANESGHIYRSNTTETTVTIDNLYSNTDYVVLVTSRNRKGSTLKSAKSRFYAPYGLPSTPVSFSLKQDVLRWSTPTYNGGSYSLVYVIEKRVADAWIRIGTTTDKLYKVDRPEAGVSIEYRVAGSTAAGLGEYTKPLVNTGTGVPNVVTDVPDLPAVLAGTLSATQRRPGSGMVNLAWSTVTGASSYTIERSPLGVESWTLVTSTTGTSRVITTMIGTKMMLKVTAKTSTGSVVVGIVQYEGTP